MSPRPCWQCVLDNDHRDDEATPTDNLLGLTIRKVCNVDVKYLVCCPPSALPPEVVVPSKIGHGYLLAIV